jgi:hypothetical protein
MRLHKGQPVDVTVYRETYKTHKICEHNDHTALDILPAQISLAS